MNEEIDILWQRIHDLFRGPGRRPAFFMTTSVLTPGFEEDLMNKVAGLKACATKGEFEKIKRQIEADLLVASSTGDLAQKDVEGTIDLLKALQWSK